MCSDSGRVAASATLAHSTCDAGVTDLESGYGRFPAALLAGSRSRCTRVLCHPYPQPEAASCLFPNETGRSHRLAATPDVSRFLDERCRPDSWFLTCIAGREARESSCERSPFRSSRLRNFSHSSHRFRTSPTPFLTACHFDSASAL